MTDKINETVDPYLNKFFYEIVKPKTYGEAAVVFGKDDELVKSVKLIGPLENIRFCIPSKVNESVVVELFTKETPYKYAQVMGGRIVAVFTESQILVTDKEL